jgi:LAO/AO transport system kinase
MEIADIFVINKCDHEGAERVEREIRALQSLAVGDKWTPPIEDRGQSRLWRY